MVVHRMQVTTTIGPTPTRQLYYSCFALSSCEMPVQTKESRPNMDDPSILGNISKGKIYLQELINWTTCNHFST